MGGDEKNINFSPLPPTTAKTRHHPTLGTFETKMVARSGLVAISTRCYGRIKDSERLEVRVVCQEGKRAHLDKLNRWKKGRFLWSNYTNYFVLRFRNSQTAAGQKTAEATGLKVGVLLGYC